MLCEEVILNSSGRVMGSLCLKSGNAIKENVQRERKRERCYSLYPTLPWSKFLEKLYLWNAIFEVSV